VPSRPHGCNQSGRFGQRGKFQPWLLPPMPPTPRSYRQACVGRERDRSLFPPHRSAWLAKGPHCPPPLALRVSLWITPPNPEPVQTQHFGYSRGALTVDDQAAIAGPAVTSRLSAVIRRVRRASILGAGEQAGGFEAVDVAGGDADVLVAGDEAEAGAEE